MPAPHPPIARWELCRRWVPPCMHLSQPIYVIQLTLAAKIMALARYASSFPSLQSIDTILSYLTIPVRSPEGERSLLDSPLGFLERFHARQ